MATRSILIVDDEYGLADILAEVLAEDGFDARIAINGKLALERIAERRPDLVLLDAMMPVLDGITLLGILRSDPELASLPVVMMTALPESLERADRSHYQDVLFKPFSPDALFAAVERILGSRTR